MSSTSHTRLVASAPTARFLQTVTEFSGDDLLLEDMLEGWDEIFHANDDDGDDQPPVTKRGESVWIDEAPTQKWPSILPTWVEQELKGAPVARRAG